MVQATVHAVLTGTAMDSISAYVNFASGHILHISQISCRAPLYLTNTQPTSQKAWNDCDIKRKQTFKSCENDVETLTEQSDKSKKSVCWLEMTVDIREK